MSADDPVPEPFVENGAPLPPPNGEGARAAAPEDVLAELALPAVTPDLPQPAYPPRPSVRVPRPPHPGIGFALLWLLLFVIVTQGAGIAVCVALILFQAFTSPNLQAFLGQLQTKEYQASAEYAAVLWPGLLVAQVISVLLGWLALRLVAGRDWPRQVALRRPGLLHVFLTLLIIPGAMLAAQGVEQLVQWLNVPHLIDLGEAMKAITHWPAWLGVLIIGFGPGIGEELWCRAFLGRGLVGRYGVVAGIVLTSLLFGIMHVEPHQVIYAPFIGVVLHFVYWTSRSLWLPMLMHTANNSLSVLAASGRFRWTSVLDRVEQAGLHYPALVYGGTLVLLLAVGYAFYQSRARVAGADGGPPPWRPAYPGVEHPPPGSGSVVVHPAPPPFALGVAAGGVAVFVGCCWLAVHLLPA